MAKKMFKVEIVQDFTTKEAAMKAANNAAIDPEQQVTVYEETMTDSGQCFERKPIWGTQQAPPPPRGYFYR